MQTLYMNIVYRHRGLLHLSYPISPWYRPTGRHSVLSCSVQLSCACELALLCVSLQAVSKLNTYKRRPVENVRYSDRPPFVFSARSARRYSGPTHNSQGQSCCRESRTVVVSTHTPVILSFNNPRPTKNVTANIATVNVCCVDRWICRP